MAFAVPGQAGALCACIAGLRESAVQVSPASICQLPRRALRGLDCCYFYLELHGRSLNAKLSLQETRRSLQLSDLRLGPPLLALGVSWLGLPTLLRSLARIGKGPGTENTEGTIRVRRFVGCPLNAALRSSIIRLPIFTAADFAAQVFVSTPLVVLVSRDTRRPCCSIAFLSLEFVMLSRSLAKPDAASLVRGSGQLFVCHACFRMSFVFFLRDAVRLVLESRSWDARILAPRCSSTA